MNLTTLRKSFHRFNSSTLTGAKKDKSSEMTVCPFSLFITHWFQIKYKQKFQHFHILSIKTAIFVDSSWFLQTTSIKTAIFMDSKRLCTFDPYAAVVRFSRNRADDNTCHEKGNDSLPHHRRCCPQQGSDNAGRRLCHNKDWTSWKLGFPDDWAGIRADRIVALVKVDTEG